MLRAVFEEGLARSIAEFGEAHGRTAQAARDLGLFLITQGDRAGARGALEQAVRVDEQLLGSAARQTLADLAELASLAEPGVAASMWQRTSASPDPAVASRSLAALGSIREQNGDRESASALYRQALAKEEAATGANSMRVAARLNTLSFVVEPVEAIAVLERALKNTASAGGHRLETASIQMNLAARLMDLSRAGRALQFATEAFATFAELLGADHPRAAASRSLRDRAAELKKITAQ